MAKFPAENSKLQLQTELEVEVEAVYGSPPPSLCCCDLLLPLVPVARCKS